MNPEGKKNKIKASDSSKEMYYCYSLEFKYYKWNELVVTEIYFIVRFHLN